MKKQYWLFFLLLAFLAGCGELSAEENTASNQQEAEEVLLEYNVETETWSPLMLQFGTKESLEAYQFAIEHPEVLDYMPCYCGCYGDAEHSNNTDCFVDSVNGSVAKLDKMGLG